MSSGTPPRVTHNQRFEAIVDEFAQPVYRRAFYMLGRRQEAEEATQDVFVRIFRSLDKFRGDSSLSTWINRITFNVCLSYRSKRGLPRMTSDPGNAAESIPADDPADNPEEAFEQSERRQEVAGLIAGLPPQEAEAVTLFYLQGLNYREIGAVLDVPPGTVATLLHRGRELLRAMAYREKREEDQ